MIPLVLVGAAGRMGRAVVEAAAGSGDFELRACVDRIQPAGATSPPWTSDLGAVLRAGDVVVEFSVPAAAAAAATLCAERGARLVSGTTGLDAAEERVMRAAAERTAVLRANNFSVGMLALRRSLAVALAALPGWDLEIVERHHRMKADSPSGTALTLARDALAARGWPEAALRHGREGRLGARPQAEIGLHAVRGGSWAGDHTLLLAGAGEWLELRHVAQDRSAFAEGALKAARFVADAAPGAYTLEAVLPSGR
ncbi:MAG: 4-hydroxy-tetrahydrodipicolinate reductase [Candidatus Eisenbacteria bacterium]